MKLSSYVCAMAGLAVAWTSAPLLAENRTVSFKEVAPPYPSQDPPLNERRAARAGDIVYTERATGLPGARLAEKLTLKNTPAGRVTIHSDHDLNKFLVEGAPYFCAAHSLRPRYRKRREAGFYICLRDGNGSPETFEEVRIIMLVLTELAKRRSGRHVFVKHRRTHEHAMSGTLSPKRFRELTVNPDDGEYYEVRVMLTEIADGTAKFKARMVDRDGDTEFESEAVSVALSGTMPKTVSIPHPFQGDMIYREIRKIDVKRGDEEKRRERAAHLEILKVEGGTVTYRVVRGFRPWRYWIEGPPRKARKRMRWRARP